MPATIIHPAELPPVESFANEPWAIDHAHFERMLSAYRSTEAAPGRDARGAGNIFSLEGERWPEPQVVGGVAILPLYGVLAPAHPWWRSGTSTERFAIQFLSALDNPDVEQIVIRTNSPGGLMFGAAELADLIFRSRGKKPITAFAVNGLMASAAYLIGSAADRVVATASSYAGNIGVILPHVEFSKMDAEAGITFNVLCRPDAKKYGNDKEPLSDEAHRALMATLIDPVYDQFVERVARNRGVGADDVKQGYGQGMALIAGQAQAAGLIDEVADWNQFLQSLSGSEETGGQATTTPSPLRMEAHQMDFTNLSQKTLATLLAAGVIGSLEIAAELLEGTVRGWCAGRGIDVPDDEETLCTHARNSLAPPPQLSPPTPPAGQTTPADGNEPNAVDVTAAVQQALQADGQRRADIEARAQLLGLETTAPPVQAALNDPTITATAFAETVMNDAIASNTPVGRVGGNIQSGDAALDKFNAAAQSAILLRCGPQLAAAAITEGADSDNTREQLAAHIENGQAVREVAGMSFAQIAQQAVTLAGITPSQRTPEGYAKAFLKLGHTGEERVFATGHALIDGPMGAYQAPEHGPGDYPNLMDGVANKIVLFATGIAPVTYHRWCLRIDDMPDYNPKQIVTVSGIPEFDEQEDAKPTRQHTFSETSAYIQVDEYSKGTKLTPKMVVNGNLAAFVRAFLLIQIGLERTVNRLGINILTTNATAPRDSVALFHANHSNIVASGGAPSITQAKSMRKLLNAQTMPGDTEEAGLDLAWTLVGSNWVTENQINFGAKYKLAPTTQAEVNPFNGTVEPLYDPMISSGGNTWYGGANPMLLEGVVYAFLAGSGPGGQRVTYFDPETRCLAYDWFVRAGFQLVNYEPFVRNPGS